MYRISWAVKNLNLDMEALKEELEEIAVKYNLKNIMQDAWDIYRANSTPDCKAVFALCLSLAWEHIKYDPAGDWSRMDANDQLRFLTACIRRAAKNEIGNSTGDNYNAINEDIAYFYQFHGLDCIRNEAYIKVTETLARLDALNATRAAKGKEPVSLVAIVYNAAKYSIRRFYRQDIKHGVAEVRTTTDADGNTWDYIDTMVHDRAADTERTALAHVAFGELLSKRDSIDRTIVQAKADGLTDSQIANMLGISQQAVNKRVRRLREDIADQLPA